MLAAYPTAKYEIKTLDASNIGNGCATLNGRVDFTSTDADEVNFNGTVGFVWGDTEWNVSDDSGKIFTDVNTRKLVNNVSEGLFETEICSLIPGKTYYFRDYTEHYKGEIKSFKAKYPTPPASCICTTEVAPVCAKLDKETKTYSNACRMTCDGAELLYQGECKETAPAYKVKTLDATNIKDGCATLKGKIEYTNSDLDKINFTGVVKFAYGDSYTNLSDKTKLFTSVNSSVTLTDLGEGEFSKEICNLETGIKYYFIAYSEHYKGEIKNFTMLGNLPTGVCNADLTLTQNIRAPRAGFVRNGRWDYYTGGLVREAHILQKHLNRLGFNAGSEDGVIGPNTRSAILRLQEYLGVTPDGFIGPETRAVLNSSCGVVITP